MKLTKVVYMPIEVPAKDYCWGLYPNDAICEHFSNEGGHETCDLGFTISDKECVYNNEGFVLKPEKCRELKEQVKEVQ